MTFWHMINTGISLLNAGVALITAYWSCARFVVKARKVESRTMDRLRRGYTGSILDDELD
jgi:hypothetical protein